MSYGQIWRANRFVADERDFAAVQNKGQQNLREQYAYIEHLLDDGREWALPAAIPSSIRTFWFSTSGVDASVWT